MQKIQFDFKGKQRTAEELERFQRTLESEGETRRRELDLQVQSINGCILILTFEI